MSFDSSPTPARVLPVLPPDQADGLLAVPWTLVSVEDGGRRIVISVAAAPGSVKGVRIAETPADVTLTVYRTPPPSGIRTLIMVHAISVVELDPPLGARHLRGAGGGR